MSILIDQNTTVLIQGITGKQGTFHAQRMLESNVKVVAGVAPGREGQNVLGVPVFNTVSEAKAHTNINASMIMVPGPFAKDAAIEAIENGIPLVVIITEFIPFQDVLEIKERADRKGTRVIGPNTIGMISPGKTKVGVMPTNIYGQGNIGLISRSGTLTHEMASNLFYRGYGLSTCICIGGDMVKQTNFVDLLKLFRNDDETERVLMIGEIGGNGEEVAAQYIKETQYPKKVFCYIAGRTAPAEKRMGHAGAIVSKGVGSAESKVAALTDAGVKIADTLEELLEFAING